MDRAAFGRYVREALDHFYEPAYLVKNPLADLLLPHAQADAATALREVLREAMDRLRPPPSVPYGAPEWNSYRILWERCIQRRPWYSISEDLALGRSSVYKYMQQAVDALATLLWKQYQVSQGAAQGVVATERATLDETAAKEAVRLAQAWPRDLVEVQSLTQDVCTLLSPLCQRLAVTIRLDVAAEGPPLVGDTAVLRQILVDIMIPAIEQSPSRMLTLSVIYRGSEAVFRVGNLPARPDTDEFLQQMDLGQQLLQSYGGRIWFEQAGESVTVAFALPAGSRPSILVADDDPETLLLYQRFLPSSDYALRVARNGPEVTAQLADSLPDLIILDVMMPREDGWMILQRLRTLPETASIPVLVYSVLAQPSLALSLGAVGVLRKPVTEADLLAAVKQALAPILQT